MFKLLKHLVGIFTAPKTEISRFENLLIWLQTKFLKLKFISLHGFKVSSPTASLLNSAVWEIFISLDYYFQCDNKSPTIIDAGANIGMATLFFKKLYPESNIVCFEPDPEAFKFLEQNIATNKLSGVSLHALALSTETRVLNFYRLINSVTSMGSLLKDEVHSETITVQAVKLSDYIECNIDFLKLDIENQELAVIQELKMNNKLKFIRKMVIDWHSKDASLAELLLVLEESGFKIQISSSCKRPFNIKNNVNLLIYACRI